MKSKDELPRTTEVLRLNRELDRMRAERDMASLARDNYRRRVKKLEAALNAKTKEAIRLRNYTEWSISKKFDSRNMGVFASEALGLESEDADNQQNKPNNK